MSRKKNQNKLKELLIFIIFAIILFLLEEFGFIINYNNEDITPTTSANTASFDL